MFKSNFLKPFFLTGALAAALGASVANAALDLPVKDIPVKLHEGSNPADSIVVNTFLSKDTIWVMNNFTLVKSGVTLTIEAGTLVRPSTVNRATLIVDRGGKLIAAGTKEAPITFQVQESAPGVPAERGLWGGIVLLGKAASNQNPNGGLQYEALGWAIFGGNKNDDNSGILTYLRLDGPGYPVVVDKELNGLTLCAVGSGTVVNHIQVHRGDDDGIEWFGGTVSGSHLVVTNQTDDGFDIDHGYSGTNQYMINIQRTEPFRVRDPGSTLPFEPVGDFSLECGSSSPGGLNPMTKPKWSNITFIDNGGYDGAMDLKEHCGGNYEKMVVVAGGAKLDSASGWAFRLQGDYVAANITAPTPLLDFKDVFVTGAWKKLYEITGIPNATTVKNVTDVLNAKIKNYPYSQTQSFGLNKDLSPSNPDIIAAKAGAIVDGDLWYQGWTLPNSMEFALGDIPNLAAPTVDLTRAAGELVAPANFTLNASAADVDGIATLEILEGTTVLASGTTGTLSFNVTNATSGTHTYTVRAKDIHAKKPFTTTKDIVVEISNPAPVVEIVVANGGTFAAPGNFILNASATDLDGIAMLEILEGTTVLASGTEGTLSFNVTSGTTGTHTYTVRGTDKNSLPLTITKNVSVSITNPLPVVNLTRTGATNLVAPATFTLNATGTDLDGIAKLEILQGTTVLASNALGTLGFNVANLAAGTYTYTVRALDNNATDPKSNEQELIVVIGVAPANIAPMVFFTPLSETPIAPATFNLKATASDTDGAISKLEILEGTTVLGGAVTGSLTVPVAGKAAGVYTYTVKATDNHPTDPKTTTSTLNVTVYDPPPVANEAAPVVTLELGALGNLVAPASFALVATGSDANGIDTIQVLLGTEVVASGTTLSLIVPITGLAAGTYTYTVRAKDKHLTDPKVSTKTLEVVVAAPAPNTAPTLNVFRSGADILKAPGSFTLHAVSSDEHGIDTLRIFQNGELIKTIAASEVSLQIEGLAEGTYIFKAIAKDKHAKDPKTTTMELTVIVKAPIPSVAIAIPLRDLNGIQIYASQGQNLILKSEGYGQVKIGIWTMGGRYVGTRDVKLNQGKNSVSMGNLRGVHIVRISKGNMSRSARVVFSTGK